MKRIISILLTGLMVVGMFGCSKKPEQITDIPTTARKLSVPSIRSLLMLNNIVYISLF